MAPSPITVSAPSLSLSQSLGNLHILRSQIPLRPSQHAIFLTIVKAVAAKPACKLSIEECEAFVVSENYPSAPPPPVKGDPPAGTPIISPLVYKARDVGMNNVVLFPKIPDALKVIYTDVALDPYSLDGDDGIVRSDGVIMNDETVYQLCKQAVAQARTGADVDSPSDMMDGRVGAIRKALDLEGFQDVSIMSYTAKFASAFYGPFREALDSNPHFGDKKTYQMDSVNYREALLEIRTDEEEGANILMVKPAMPCLDVIKILCDTSPLPISAYQVSGEYSMIRAAVAQGILDEKKAILESLLCIKRVGANIILTYFALQVARYLAGEKI